MKRIYLSAVCAAAMLALGITHAAVAQNGGVPVIDGPTYLMTYAEVVPSTAAQAAAMLKEYRDASRKEAGAMQIDLYQEKGQSHRFVVEEIWQNRAIAQGHITGATTAALGAKLKPIAMGPLDIRIHQAHAVTPAKTPNANDTILISHVDVAGNNTQNLIVQLNRLNAATLKEGGVVRYEILDEVPAHANHFRVLEEWATPAAWEAHDKGAAMQAYRDAILPMLGTPYDQRLYSVVQ